jgi:hypothetical protein
VTAQPSREVHIHRAELNASVDPAEPVVIHIDQTQPDMQYGEPGFAGPAAELFQTDGNALADAIWESCPGGTVDALLSALFARKASQFRVRFPQEVAE